MFKIYLNSSRKKTLLSKDTAYCKYFLKRLPIGVIYLEYANLCMYLIGKRFETFGMYVILYDVYYLIFSLLRIVYSFGDANMQYA